MNIIMIRHGATAGNLERRYVGSTDEPLCAEGIEQIRQGRYPCVEQLVTSPMTRCIETAALIYPALPPMIIDGLRECDFGAFEYMNYQELSGDRDYQAYIDSGGEASFPLGESKARFCARSCAAFEVAMDGLASDRDTAFVVHGGTIMAVLSTYAEPARSYFDWQLKNGGMVVLDASRWANAHILKRM